MAKNNRHNPEVEQDAAEFQLLFLNKLTGFGRPVELVLAVTEDMTEYKDHQAHIRENDP
ncbi:hypothetical protein D3C80_2139500 [compost metagenome]